MYPNLVSTSHIETVMAANMHEEDDELLIRLNCTGLCMSDVHYMLNDWGIPKMVLQDSRKSVWGT